MDAPNIVITRKSKTVPPDFPGKEIIVWINKDAWATHETFESIFDHSPSFEDITVNAICEPIRITHEALISLIKCQKTLRSLSLMNVPIRDFDIKMFSRCDFTSLKILRIATNPKGILDKVFGCLDELRLFEEVTSEPINLTGLKTFILPRKCHRLSVCGDMEELEHLTMSCHGENYINFQNVMKYAKNLKSAHLHICSRVVQYEIILDECLALEEVKLVSTVRNPKLVLKKIEAPNLRSIKVEGFNDEFISFSQ